MSSNDVAICVTDLSKRYEIYATPRDRLKQFVLPPLQRLAGRPGQYFREFWALKDVSFEVKRGETVGIIGRNGSGKSTLLQIICGTLNPTSGNIRTNGRIAALLELGSGFNPEFTGRENVYLNGAILGLDEAEINARFDDIAAFADIGDFIEQPVKTYSTGMMVRLAFAVAINVDPQILIVDEALSVGDELFQRKCFSRIETIKRNGATILFVSHSGGAIVELCDHAVLLDSGEKLAMGAPKAIVGKYQKLIYAPQDKRDAILEEIRAFDGNSQDSDLLVVSKNLNENISKDETVEFFDPNLRPQSTLEYESHGVHIESLEILTMSGKRVNSLKSGETYCYTYLVKFELDSYDVRFGMLIKAMNGTELGGIGSSLPGHGIEKIPGGAAVSVRFHFKCNLLPGLYFLNAGCNGKSEGGEAVFLHRIIDALAFRVLPESRTEDRAGYIEFSAQFPACNMEYL